MKAAASASPSRLSTAHSVLLFTAARILRIRRILGRRWRRWNITVLHPAIGDVLYGGRWRFFVRHIIISLSCCYQLEVPALSEEEAVVEHIPFSVLQLPLDRSYLLLPPGSSSRFPHDNREFTPVYRQLQASRSDPFRTKLRREIVVNKDNSQKQPDHKQECSHDVQDLGRNSPPSAWTLIVDRTSVRLLERPP